MYILNTLKTSFDNKIVEKKLYFILFIQSLYFFISFMLYFD